MSQAKRFIQVFSVLVLVALISLAPMTAFADDGECQSLSELANADEGSCSSPAVQTETVQVETVTNGSLVFFTDRGSFNGSCPNLPSLPVEDFEEANVSPGGTAACARPVDSTTNNGIFSPGDIEPGLSITSIGPDQGGAELAVLGAGAFGVPSKAVFSNFFVDYTAVEFTNGGVACVGMDLFEVLYDDPNMQISIYGDSGLLGSTTAPGTTAGSFFGVCSDEAITRIEIASLITGGEGVDNIVFGRCSVPSVGGTLYPVNKVTLLIPWIALAAAIIAGGVILIRRRRIVVY